MKRYNFLFTITVLLLGLVSCEKDLLNKIPLDSYSESVVWKDANLVQLYVNAQYNVFMTPGFEFVPLNTSSACDESRNQYGYNNVGVFNSGSLEPSSSTSLSNYVDLYKYIRNCNLFISKQDEIKGDTDLINRMKGEIFLIRAYCYEELIKRYGGVVITTKPVELGSDYSSTKRSSYEDCVNLIVSDCDAAAAILPATQTGTNFGRATKGAAMALKARVLLYAASDLFDHTKNTEVTKDVYGYTSGSQTDRYRLAQTAAKAVIDLPTYHLYAGDYNYIFSDVTDELILFKLVDPQYSFPFELIEAPNGQLFPQGWSANQPNQSLVDAFGMSDGLSITESPLYDPQNPYANRDPRFYADIYYDNAVYCNTHLEFFDGGINSTLNPNYPDAKNCSQTGYTLKKHLKPNFNWFATGFKGYGQPWGYIRLAEMYLNYAEASYYVGDEDLARSAINKLRQRLTPAVPDVPGTTTGVALETLIRRERQVELCFEEHRFYDVRRWMIANTTENTKIRGMHIVKDAVTNVKTYTVRDVENRTFTAPQHYLMPIPKSELDKINIGQNPGY